jgi:hypothetical protein
VPVNGTAAQAEALGDLSAILDALRLLEMRPRAALRSLSSVDSVSSEHIR